MRIIIPVGDWLMKLCDALETSNNDDEIIVKTQAIKELAEMAKERICPDKNIIFIIEAENISKP